MLVVSIYLVVKRHTFWSISNFSKRFYDPFFGLGGLLSREVIKYDQLTTSIAHKHWYTYSVIQTKLYLFKWIETGKKNHSREIPFTILKFYLYLHSSKINVLRSSLNSKETLQNFLYLYKKKTQVVFFVFHFEQLSFFPL